MLLLLKREMLLLKCKDKIDDFKQNGGYMKGVKVTPDKTGKPIFTSQGDVLTKKTDNVVKSQENFWRRKQFPTMNNKQQMIFLKKMGYRCRRASGGEETVTCYMDDVKITRYDLKGIRM